MLERVQPLSLVRVGSSQSFLATVQYSTLKSLSSQVTTYRVGNDPLSINQRPSQRHISDDVGLLSPSERSGPLSALNQL